MYLITVPLSAGTHIDVRIDVGGSDIGDAGKAHVLCLAADSHAADWLTVLPVAADSSCFGLIDYS